MTTDPIELWASPASRSRVERAFFDETFRPFYRTEQIIIHAKNLDTVRIAICRKELPINMCQIFNVSHQSLEVMKHTVICIVRLWQVKRRFPQIEKACGFFCWLIHLKMSFHFPTSRKGAVYFVYVNLWSYFFLKWSNPCLFLFIFVLFNNNFTEKL